MYRPSARAVLVVHLEDARVGVVGDQVGPLGEGDAVERGRREEDAVVQHALGLELGAQRGDVDVVLRLRAPSRCRTPSPSASSAKSPSPI